MQKPGNAPRLIIVCGLPGAGKTTLAQTLEVKLGAVRFSADEWMEALSINLWSEEKRAEIERLQWKLGQELLARSISVIIEWGTWGRSERDALRTQARDLGAKVELHYLSAPVDVLLVRIQRRGMEDPPIDREMLSRWSKMIDVPTAEEMALFDQPSTGDAEESASLFPG